MLNDIMVTLSEDIWEKIILHIQKSNNLNRSLLLIINIKLVFKNILIKKYLIIYKSNWEKFYKYWDLFPKRWSIPFYNLINHYIIIIETCKRFKLRNILKIPYVLSSKFNIQLNYGSKWTRNMYKYLFNNHTPYELFTIFTYDSLKWKCLLVGPPDTPYSGGLFLLDIIYDDKAPYSVPYIKFVNQIYHPNINCRGELDIDILEPNNWSCLYGKLDKLITGIISFLDDPMPFCNNNKNYDNFISSQYIYNKSEYIKTARKWTLNYACLNYNQVNDWLDSMY